MSFNLFILSFCIFPYRLSSFSFTLTASIALYANCLVHFNISESSPLLFLPSPFLFLFPPSPCQSFSLCSRCWVIFFCSHCQLLVEFHASSSSVLFPSLLIFQTGLGMRLLPFTLWSMLSVGSLFFAILTQCPLLSHSLQWSLFMGMEHERYEYISYQN